jgi:hypothetical protein
MQNLVESIASYVRETRRLESLPSSTETTFYPDLKLFLSAVLKNERLPFDVITGTSEAGPRRHDMPDFVLGDSSLFVGVYGEVKRANSTLANLAVSTEQNDQIGRYLAQTGVVLLSNVRGFGLLTCDPSYVRVAGTPVPPEKRVLEKTVDLWSAVTGSGTKPKTDASAVNDLVSIVTRAVTDLAHIGSPADLAKILARQARDAKEALPVGQGSGQRCRFRGGARPPVPSDSVPRRSPTRHPAPGADEAPRSGRSPDEGHQNLQPCRPPTIPLAHELPANRWRDNDRRHYLFL